VKNLMDALAASLVYPGRPTAAAALAAAGELDRLGDEVVATTLRDLTRYLDDAPPGEAEERYTPLFDMSPTCTLDIGYHLYGDGYERGALLAGLTRELDAAGIDLGGQLPDWLPLQLRLFARLAADDRALLFEAVLRPGLKKMEGLLRDGSDPWSGVLRVLRPLLAQLAGVPADSPAGAEPTTRLPMAPASAEDLHA